MGSRVGLLFVHGIGMQRPGATLASMGDPLIDWIERWCSSRGGELVIDTPSEIDGQPRHVLATWHRDGSDATKLVLAECWWADAFAVPSVGKVLAWAPRIGYRVLGRIGAGIVLGVLVVYMVVMGFLFSWDLRAWSVAAGTLVAVALLPYILLLLVGVMSVVPGLRSFAQAVISWLAQAGGDAYSLMQSPTQFSSMRSRVASDLEWMGAQVDEVIVVAHSQGSVVALETLIARRDLRVHTYITLGSAVRLLMRARTEPVERFRLAQPRCSWFNLYNRFDPVSAGPINQQGTFPVDIAVTSEGAPWSAHTSYVRDVEGLHLLLLACIAEASGQPAWKSAYSRTVRLALSAARHRANAILVFRIHEVIWIAAGCGVAWSGGLPQDAAQWLTSSRLIPNSMLVLGVEIWQVVVASAIAAVVGIALFIAQERVLAGPAQSFWRRRWIGRILEGQDRAKLDPTSLVPVAALLPLTGLVLYVTRLYQPDDFKFACTMAGISLFFCAEIALGHTSRQLPERERRLFNARHAGRMDDVEKLTLPDRVEERFAATFGLVFSAYQDRIRALFEYSEELVQTERRVLLGSATEQIVDHLPGSELVAPDLIFAQDLGAEIKVVAMHSHSSVPDLLTFNNHLFQSDGPFYQGAEMRRFICVVVCMAATCSFDDPATAQPVSHMLSWEATLSIGKQHGRGGITVDWPDFEKLSGEGFRPAEVLARLQSQPAVDLGP